jgi:hypothetical protein
MVAGNLSSNKSIVQKTLLLCGLISSLLYVVTDIVAAICWEAYSYTSQTVSELIAIDAPTRPYIVPLFIIYALLIYAFGIGIWRSDSRKRVLRFAGIGLIGKEVLGLAVTLFFPIHMRGIEGTLSDVMHGILTGVGVLFILLAMVFGAVASGKKFCFYSIGTIVILIIFGILTGTDASKIELNLPTPYMGVWERVNIFAYMLWVVVFAIGLLRVQSAEVRKSK